MQTGRDPERTTKPVIPSTISANESLQRWLKENNFREVTDQAGITWHLGIHVDNIPDQADNKGLLWQATIEAEALVSFDDLVRTGTFQTHEDDRIGQLMGRRRLELRAKPFTTVGSSEEVLKTNFIDLIQDVRSSLQSRRLDQVKRRLVGDWLQKRFDFATEK